MVRHHHISMFTHDLKENNQFYMDILGLRRVKITVNQNLPEMYHIFYGDTEGSAGNDFTFFDYSQYPKRKKGTNAISGYGFFVNSEASLDFWEARLASLNIQSQREAFFGSTRLVFEDVSGIKLWFELKKEELPEQWEPWHENDIPEEHVIQGMSAAEVTVRDVQAFVDMMADLFDYYVAESNESVSVITTDGQATINVHQQDGRIEKAGQGTIHHIAIQIEDDNFDRIKAEIEAKGYKTIHYDRHFFDSLYFRGANSIMLEIVASGAIGLNPEKNKTEYGQKLELPPKFEPRRKELGQVLTPIEEWI